MSLTHAASMSTNLSRCKGVLNVVSVENSEGDTWLGKKARLNRGLIEFGDEDLEGMT